MKKDWKILKGIIQVFNQKTKNCPYLTDEELERFEKIMKSALRLKKLEKILK
ncbi:MAG: hypothetical protein HPY57_14840 [Ignavibacteria bacterium]|nr:hypothetical protein [Ignavibacteria bacterium]